MSNYRTGEPFIYAARVFLSDKNGSAALAFISAFH